jgi:glycosyltransferase involved in cell wall biosynthesis
MKIGIVHTSYVQRGGEDVAMEQEYDLLRSSDVKVSLLHFKNPASNMAKVINVFRSVFNYSSYIKTVQWIRLEKPDIIHVHNWHFRGSPAIIRAAKKHKIPVVHSLHNFRLLCPSATLFHHDHIFLNSLRVNFPWEAVYYRVYRNSMLQTFLLALTVWVHKHNGTWKSVARFIVLTSNAREIFLMAGKSLNLTPEKIVIKSNFTNDLAYEEAPRSGTFLFVGRLTFEKGVQTLLEAFKNSGLPLSIIGDGPLRHEVESAAATHSNITFMGFRDREYILRSMKKSTALICPSLWLEGNPITIIEAFSSGTPVITSRLGAMECMVTDRYNGRFFQPGNSEDLQKVLREWTAHTPLQQKLFRQQARQTY